MEPYTAEIIWSRGDQNFLDNKYSRRHILHFDAGIDVPGSSSPRIVPAPYSDISAIDPEEAFVASISSCHMLWFLFVAAKAGFVVDHYVDSAIGVMEKNAQGKLAISVVTLRPHANFSGEKLPTNFDIDKMHHQAHEKCYIANSVKSEVRCEPIYDSL